METNQVWAVVVAAGRGERFGKPYNKVFHQIEGRSILSRCMDALKCSEAFDGIILVLSEQDDEAYAQLIEHEGRCPLIKKVIHGGNTRQESVFNGLTAVPQEVRLVAVHDAARPFVENTLIHALIDAAIADGAAIPGKPMTDTVKQMDEDGYAVDTVERNRLCTVQTPQIFNRKELIQAHLYAQEDAVVATDDAALYERYIGRVRVVMRPECDDNIKVTTQRDIRNVRVVIPRIGHGYDAHRLVKDRKLVLCGVDIPYERGLLGHSDADVAIHALIDALLGAAGLGDIGRHFPDNESQYKDISSMILLERVLHLLKSHRFSPCNVDLTIVAQRPKLKEYISQMQKNICDVLELPSECANVKATTTEGMGFEGEGLGISAQAVVLLVSCEQDGGLKRGSII